jgi:hypothetical protein
MSDKLQLVVGFHQRDTSDKLKFVGHRVPHVHGSWRASAHERFLGHFSQAASVPQQSVISYQPSVINRRKYSSN